MGNPPSLFGVNMNIQRVAKCIHKYYSTLSLIMCIHLWNPLYKVLGTIVVVVHFILSMLFSFYCSNGETRNSHPVLQYILVCFKLLRFIKEDASLICKYKYLTLCERWRHTSGVDLKLKYKAVFSGLFSCTNQSIIHCLSSSSHLIPCCASDMTQGTIGDMAELGITESFQVKRQVLLSAAEAAEMILRVDDIIKAAPRWVKSSHTI